MKYIIKDCTSCLRQRHFLLHNLFHQTAQHAVNPHFPIHSWSTPLSSPNIWIHELSGTILILLDDLSLGLSQDLAYCRWWWRLVLQGKGNSRLLPLPKYGIILFKFNTSNFRYHFVDLKKNVEMGVESECCNWHYNKYQLCQNMNYQIFFSIQLLSLPKYC